MVEEERYKALANKVKDEGNAKQQVSRLLREKAQEIFRQTTELL